MLKKITVSLVAFQFVVTILGQLMYLHSTVATAELAFARQAQRYFDGEGDAPAFCLDDGRFSTLRATVRVGEKKFSVAGKSDALCRWIEGILPCFALWMAVSLLSACLLSGGIYTALQTPLLAIRRSVTDWQGEGGMPEFEIFCEDEVGRMGKSIADSLGRAEAVSRGRMGRMRHELLNPLAAMRGAAESMWEETGNGLAHLLMEESDRMEETLLSETGSGGMRNEKAVCSLSRLAKDVFLLCRGMAKREGRESDVKIGRLSRWGRGDERAWRAAILNLQQNALRHSPSGSKTLLFAFEREGYAVFLFFNRVAEGRGGDGSGLATVRKICRENGGRFWSGKVEKGGYTAVLSIPVL